MTPRGGGTWPLLVVAVALAALGAASGGMLALTYRPIGLAYLDVLTRCPPSASDPAMCLTEATWAVGALMTAGAAIALGSGLAGTLVTTVCAQRRIARLSPAHPMAEARFEELCRQHRLVGSDRPRLRIGGHRTGSTAGPGQRAAVVLPAAAVRQPLVPVVFDPLVRAELDRIASGRSARRAVLRGWPWLLASVSAALAAVAAFTGTAFTGPGPGTPAGSTTRVLLLTAAVAGLTVGLRRCPGGTRGARTVAWCAVPAAGVIAGAGGQAGASILWHLAPAAGDRLVAGAALAPALLVLAGLLPVLTAGRPGATGSPGAAAVPATLAGVVAGLLAFPVGTAAAPGLAAPLLVQPSPAVPDGGSDLRGADPRGGSDPQGSDPDRARRASPGGPRTARPVPIDTTTANRAARAVEPVLGPAWRADPLPAPPPAGSRPAGCQPSIVDDYLRRVAAGRTGQGVARYATRAAPGNGGLGRTTLQIDVVSYRPDAMSSARPVDMVFAAVERAGAACREFTDGRSGLRVQSLPRAAPAVGDRAWRMDLVRTLGRGAGRVTATTALAVIQVDTTLVVVAMTASLAVVDGELFEQAMRRTVAELVAVR
ncbi:hypothetical protein EDC02_1998 [Micromonospora sp. Llam0]|uniref:hypothetical protein n=1 Tax=Micromonospora sp. Llam0 TaxID=2485143 RepID=UPI000F46A56A|nr:hypothetical protein [Micromonospora sp. Llam0]ROO60140.1 hypothetical protein EDC02_1998 [Micromonospora sp. Llam0]